MPHLLYGDGYDKLFCHLAHRAITAPQAEIADVYVNILTEFKKSEEHQRMQFYPRTKKAFDEVGGI